jgi:hypothetical protein
MDLKLKLSNKVAIALISTTGTIITGLIYLFIN